MESLSRRSLVVLAVGAGVAAGLAALLYLRRADGNGSRRRRGHGKTAAAASAAAAAADASSSSAAAAGGTPQGLRRMLQRQDTAQGLQTIVPRKYFEIGRALQKTELAGQFSTKQLQVLYDEFQRHAEGAGASEGSFRVVSADARSTRRLTKVEFSRIFSRMGITDPDLVDANFRLWDVDGDETVDFSELLTALAIMTKGTKREKLEYLFRAYDLDKNGVISREELCKIYQAQLAAMGKPHDDDIVQKAVANLMLDLKPQYDHGLTFDEFMKLANVKSFVLDSTLMERFGEEMSK